MIGGAYGDCFELLRRRVAEPAPGRIQLLTGPRQVGKTTLLLELADTIGPSAFYAACDSPEAALPGFWERLWSQRTSGVLLLDEIQHVGGWAARLKAEWDRIRRRKVPVHVVATGSSALRLGSGSRESLAGRFERLTLTHWPASALADQFLMKPDDAASTYVRLGSYPGAMQDRGDPRRWAAYVRDAIVEPAIGRDILAMGSVRRPALLRQVFAACIAAPAQIVSLQKLQGSLQDRGAIDTIAHYLQLLEDAYLVVPLQKHSTRPLRQRASPPKIVVLNNALLAATDPRGSPDSETEPERFGAWVENACLAHAWSAGHHVAYWREEPLEVDGVVDGPWGKWAIEIKTSRFETQQLRGLLEFARRHPSYRPIVVCGAEQRDVAGVKSTSWRRFLLHGPS